MHGPDHKASLEPGELAAMVAGIRDIELAIGDGVKGPRLSEIKNKEVGRKSLVAAKDIAAGELFDRENLEIKRPGSGVSPYRYWDLLNTQSSKSYREGEVILG